MDRTGTSVPPTPADPAHTMPGVIDLIQRSQPKVADAYRGLLTVTPGHEMHREGW